MTDALIFPSDFLWGTATAAHQIEGNNTNSDWWRFEHTPGSGCVDASGDACDSWHRYEDDLDIVKELGLNSFRFSVEWARIEPARGEYSRATLEHYRRVMGACRDRGILPVVTLHHFTLPQWVADAGGFEAPDIATWMGEYATVVAEALGDLVGLACTINEPNIVAIMGYYFGIFPPQVRDWDRFVAVNETMRRCHVAMRDALKAGPGDYPVGLTLSMTEYQAIEGGEERMLKSREEMEDAYLRSVADDDFLGVQCYSRTVFGPDGAVGETGETTDMGYAYWPQCVEHTVRRAAEVAGCPLVVTENGISGANDERRIAYLDAALRGLHRALDDGIDCRGYFQWSLLDNFEWVLGYTQKFGIVSVDRETMARSPKPSADWFGTVARGNSLSSFAPSTN
ncbi:MAG: family 1 glycosylhydrolase [Actinomycetota bacterium]